MSAYCNEIYKGHTIEINQDDMAENPRDWDNMGTMVCFHKRYNLGDKDEHGFDMFNLNKFIERDDIYSLPLYLFDHGGITISTIPFSCGWDSGQIGHIYVAKQKIQKEWKQDVTDEEIYNLLKAEIEIYDDYLRGYVYGYYIPDLDDSCWGYYGDDHTKSGLLNDAKSLIDYALKRKQEKRHKKIKAWIKHQVPFNYRLLNLQGI